MKKKGPFIGNEKLWVIFLKRRTKLSKKQKPGNGSLFIQLFNGFSQLFDRNGFGQNGVFTV